MGPRRLATVSRVTSPGRLDRRRAGGKTEDVRGFDGTVELTKSDATDVEGTIDLEKDGVSVKGTFKATKRP